MYLIIFIFKTFVFKIQLKLLITNTMVFAFLFIVFLKDMVEIFLFTLDRCRSVIVFCSIIFCFFTNLLHLIVMLTQQIIKILTETLLKIIIALIERENNFFCPSITRLRWKIFLH